MQTQQSDPAADVLTVAEAAAVLGVSRGTLYNWRVAKYGPPTVRDSSPVMYLRAEVEAWAESERCSKCGKKGGGSGS